MADNRQKITLDHNIFIPEGAEGISYSDNYYEDWDETGIADDESDQTPAVPEKFVVISQTLRSVRGGGYVVDVVIETDDYNDQTEIDTRITKEGAA